MMLYHGHISILIFQQKRAEEKNGDTAICRANSQLSIRGNVNVVQRHQIAYFNIENRLH